MQFKMKGKNYWGQEIKEQTRPMGKVAFLRKIADTSKETDIAKNVL